MCPQEAFRVSVLIFIIGNSLQFSQDYLAVEYSLEELHAHANDEAAAAPSYLGLSVFYKVRKGQTGRVLLLSCTDQKSVVFNREAYVIIETSSKSGSYQTQRKGFIWEKFDELSLLPSFYAFLSITAEESCKVNIGDKDLHRDKSLEGTVVAFTGGVDKDSFCFEEMNPSILKNIEFPLKFENATKNLIPFSKLCGKNGIVLVVNEQNLKDHNDIQTEFCQRLGGRYFKDEELKILQDELLLEVKSKCRTRKGESSTLVWTEKLCTFLDMNTLNKNSSCFPAHACFLCFIPKPNITLRSDRLGDFTNIILEESKEGEGPFTLESEDVTITHSNAKWHLNFKKIKDKYYLNSSLLPFGRKEWQSKLSKEITDVISIDNCQQRESCHDGTCFTPKRKCRNAKYCKDGSDKSICKEGFPYYLRLRPEQLHRVCGANAIILKNKVLLEGFKDTELGDEGLDMTLGFTNQWFDVSLGFHETRKQEFNGTKLPFSPSANLILYDCHSEENLPRNVSSSNFWFMYYSEFYGAGVMTNNFSASFHVPCQFFYYQFPYGTQSCKFCLSFKDCRLVALSKGTPSNIIISDKSMIVGAFLLKNITQKLLDPYRIEIQIQLESSPALIHYHTLTSFIPTLLMCLIAYCTLYFSMKNFAERIGLSATSLLTLVVLFTDAIDRTGVRTSYAKFIDSWFIGSVVFAAVVVVINALLHYLLWHRMYGCKCLDFSSWKRCFKKAGTGSVQDITSLKVKVEDGSGITAEEHEMDSPTENPPPMSETQASVSPRGGSGLEETETDSPTPIARRINAGSRILLLCVIATGVGVLIFKNL